MIFDLHKISWSPLPSSHWCRVHRGKLSLSNSCQYPRSELAGGQPHLGDKLFRRPPCLSLQTAPGFCIDQKQLSLDFGEISVNIVNKNLGEILCFELTLLSSFFIVIPWGQTWTDWVTRTIRCCPTIKLSRTKYQKIIQAMHHLHQSNNAGFICIFIVPICPSLPYSLQMQAVKQKENLNADKITLSCSKCIFGGKFCTCWPSVILNPRWARSYWFCW